MDPKEDPEEYIRDLERGISQPPGATPQPSSSGSATFWQRFQGVADLFNTTGGRLISAGAMVSVIAILFVLGQCSGTTVQGNLVMINAGAKDTIDCNDGNLRLEGDNNTYTVTGHCRRIDVFGSANHVALDSADHIDVFGDDNTMSYLSGSPIINKTGNNNTVSLRPGGR